MYVTNATSDEHETSVNTNSTARFRPSVVPSTRLHKTAHDLASAAKTLKGKKFILSAFHPFLPQFNDN